jgi:mutual gliding-motility protein MglA
MAHLDPNNNKINYKIILAGPAQGGKSTSLRSIINEIKGKDNISPLDNITSTDHHLEFLPLALKDKDNTSIALHLYSLPSQKYFDTLTKTLIKGIDGIVHIFDSKIETMPENIEYLEYINTLLQQEGVNCNRLAQVYQYNKRDLEKIIPIDLMRQTLNPEKKVEIESSSLNNKGTVDSLLLVVNQILNLEPLKK